MHVQTITIAFINAYSLSRIAATSSPLFTNDSSLKDDTLDIVKIADFGLSQFYRPGVLIKCDGSGTISSSAPELFAKNAAFQGETYNLGMQMIHVLCVVCG